MHSIMAPQEWIYQLPYQKFLQSLIRSEEVMTYLSFLSALFSWKPGICRHSVVLGSFAKLAL